MSYVRFGSKSDVYVYQDIDSGLRCCACIFGSSFETRSRQAMIEHLEKHIEAGHKVPGVIETLLSEIAECGDDSPGAMHLAMERRRGRMTPEGRLIALRERLNFIVTRPAHDRIPDWARAAIIDACERSFEPAPKASASVATAGPCVAPNGRTDGHLRFVESNASGELVCAFCKRPRAE